MKLSKNFSLEEFLVSETAERNDIDMTPPPGVIENLEKLVSTCMQPLREELGVVIYITSGYRPRELNELIGGSKTSAHMTGSACDFHVVGMTPLEVCQKVEDMQLPYDQIIHEFGRWSHLGISLISRSQELTAYRHLGQTRYIEGLFTIESLAG